MLPWEAGPVRSRAGRPPCGEVERLQARAGGQPRDPAALGDRVAVDFLQIAREVDRLRAGDIGAYGEGVDRRAGVLEDANAIRVQSAADDDPDVREARLVKSGAAF